MHGKVDEIWEALVRFREETADQREACEEARLKMVQRYARGFPVALEIVQCKDLIRTADASDLPALQARLKELQAISSAMQEAEHHCIH